MVVVGKRRLYFQLIIWFIVNLNFLENSQIDFSRNIVFYTILVISLIIFTKQSELGKIRYFYLNMHLLSITLLNNPNSLI